MRVTIDTALSVLVLASFVASGEARAAASVEEVFAQVYSSVVTLYTVGETGLRDAEGNAQTESGQGSGVLIGDGKILTAAHVVHSSDRVVVQYVNGTRVNARVIGSAYRGDIALLQLEEAPPKGIRPVELGNSDDVRIGSRCLVIGAPKNLSHTLTVGHISARRGRDHPDLDILDIEHFQTDASINPGNSGGPMFDMRGRVIGIVTHIKSEVRQSSGLGFAVTSNAARKHLLERNPIWSGMTEVFLTGGLARALNLPDGRSGFLLQRVAKGSPAARLGLVGGSIPASIGRDPILLGGDILLEAMGKTLDSHEAGLSLLNALPDMSASSRISVIVLRGGKAIKLEAAAGDLAPWIAKPGSPR